MVRKGKDDLMRNTVAERASQGGKWGPNSGTGDFDGTIGGVLRRPAGLPKILDLKINEDYRTARTGGWGSNTPWGRRITKTSQNEHSYF